MEPKSTTRSELHLQMDIPVPRNKVGLLIGKLGATISAVRALTGASLRVVEEPRPNAGVKGVKAEELQVCRMRASNQETLEYARRVVESIVYREGVMYMAREKVDNSQLLRHVETKTGVEVRLRATPYRDAMLVLIISDDMAGAQRARRLLAEKQHFFHTPDNLARKREKVRRREETKKENLRVTRAAAGASFLSNKT